MGRSDKFLLYRRLRPALLGREPAPSYAHVAAELGMTEGAVKMAALRLRARYRELLRREIARTVADPGDVDEEIGSLLAALAS